MKCALNLLDQCGTLQKMSTGSAEIDSLIDGIQESSFYLFYSSPENHLILDSLLYRQLIGCILPKSNKKNGFESAAIFLNNIDFSIDKKQTSTIKSRKNCNHIQICWYRTKDCVQEFIRANSI